PEPVSVHVDTYDTGELPDGELGRLVADVFDLRPAAIIERLDLLQPKYYPTAKYGHFGRGEFAWEQLDHVEALKSGAEALRQPTAA
ncbi:MAG: methionine adenosyltransferase, partial [Bacteroidetes bacterium QS_8_64_10]